MPGCVVNRVRAGVIALRETLADLVVVGLGATGEHVGEIEPAARRGDLGEASTGFRADHDREIAGPHFDLFAPVAVQIAAGPCRQGRLDNGVDAAFGLQQGLLDRAAQVREIAASEYAVPVRVVGLSPPEREACGGEPSVTGPIAFGCGQRVRQTNHLPVRVGDLRILHQERPPEPASEQAL